MASYLAPTRWLAGGLLLEHAVWEGLTTGTVMSTIKSLQLANELSIPIIDHRPLHVIGDYPS